MRLVNFRWKIVISIIAVLILWQSLRIWFLQDERMFSIEVQESLIVTPSSLKDDQQKVSVAVYYEALCPDSRSFFIKQLLPTYQKISKNLRLEFVPYGKATTIKVDDSYEFVCQHGPIECQANVIHACSIDVIKDPSVQLEYLCCMIKNNIDPIGIMEACAEKLNVDSDSISKCATGTRGKELLAKYGEKTNGLRPSVAFIPTVTLDGDTSNQARILKNLLHEVCLHLKVMPEGCTS